MSYDALEESVALIESKALRAIPRLSRRRRFVPLAVDVAGDIAATMFLRRGAGCVHQEVWQLVLRDQQWHLLGGAGGTSDDDEDLLADRPHIIADEMRGPWNTLPGIDPQVLTGGAGAGGVHDSMGREGMFPWSGRWISHTTLFASAQVCSTRVDDREITVPWHGRTLVTWVGRKPPKVVSAYAANGQHLGTARLAN